MLNMIIGPFYSTRYTCCQIHYQYQMQIQKERAVTKHKRGIASRVYNYVTVATWPCTCLFTVFHQLCDWSELCL